MYTLYFLPGACSLATQVVLRELELPFQLMHKNMAADFDELSPLQQVPVLRYKDEVLTEGAAIMLHLLEKRANNLWPQAAEPKQKALTDLMFANATMHPAYSKLFFINQHIDAGPLQDKVFQAAAHKLTQLWLYVESRLAHSPYLAGEQPGVADILLAVYSRWGQYFPVQIDIGERTATMLQQVIARPAFQQALQAEQLNNVVGL